MARMIATKPLIYNTRRMRPGDEFKVQDNHVSLFVAMNKARLAPPPMVAEKPKPPQQQQSPSIEDTAPQNDLTELRNQATAMGLAIDMRWGVKRLQSAILRAKTQGLI